MLLTYDGNLRFISFLLQSKLPLFPHFSFVIGSKKQRPLLSSPYCSYRKKTSLFVCVICILFSLLLLPFLVLSNNIFHQKIAVVPS